MPTPAEESLKKERRKQTAEAVRVAVGLSAMLTAAYYNLVPTAAVWRGEQEPTFVLPAVGILAAFLGYTLMPKPKEFTYRRQAGILLGMILVITVVSGTFSLALATLKRLASTFFISEFRWRDETELLNAMRWTALVVASWFCAITWRIWLSCGHHWMRKPHDEIVHPGTADIVLGTDDDGNPVVLEEADRYMHMLVQGPTGSGKTATGLSPGIVQDIANPRVGITVIEPKGDWINGDFGRPGIMQWAAHYGRTVYKIDPADPYTDVINPLHGDRHMVAEVNTVALKVLFGHEQNFFSTAQEALLKKCLYLLKWLKGDELTYWDLHRVIRDFRLMVSMARDLDARLQYWRAVGLPEGITQDDVLEIEDLLRWFRIETQGEAGEKLQEVTLGLRVQMDNLMNNAYFRRCVVPPPEPFRDENGNIIGGRVVDIDKHLANGSILAVSTNDGLLADYSKVLGRMVITAIQYAASRRFMQPPEKRGPHMIWIDEAPTYLTPAWGEFQAKARGFNIGIILALQDLAQLEKVERGFRNTIVGQSRTRLLYGGLPPDDIEFWSKAFGTKQVEIKSQSVSDRYTSNPYGGSLFFPTTTKQVTVTESTRTSEKERVEFNQLWELPRGKVLLQKVKHGSVQPPQFLNVSLVKELPPLKGKPQDLDPMAGVAVPSGPLLPPVPGAVLGGDLGEPRGTYTLRDARRDAAAKKEQKQEQPRSFRDRVAKYQDPDLQAPPHPPKTVPEPDPDKQNQLAENGPTSEPQENAPHPPTQTEKHSGPHTPDNVIRYLVSDSKKTPVPSSASPKPDEQTPTPPAAPRSVHDDQPSEDLKAPQHSANKSRPTKNTGEQDNNTKQTAAPIAPAPPVPSKQQVQSLRVSQADKNKADLAVSNDKKSEQPSRPKSPSVPPEIEKHLQEQNLELPVKPPKRVRYRNHPPE